MTKLADEYLPETEDQFERAVEASGVMDWLLDRDAPDPESDTADTGQPRDPDTGRFLPQAGEETPEETPGESSDEGPVDTADTPEAEETEDEPLTLDYDDDVAEILERYGGDLNKALRSLKESQSMVGRQGNELGELKQQLQELAQLVQDSGRQQYVRSMPYQNDIDENPQGLFYEALERGDTQTIQEALRSWGEVEPFDATLALVGMMNVPAMEQAPPQGGPLPAGPSHIEDAMKGVVERHPDVETFLPEVEKLGQEFPTLRGALASDNPSVQAQAFEELLVIAKSRQAADTSREAMKRVVLKQAEEVRTEKSDARVVSASKQSAAQSRQDKIQQFYDDFQGAAGRYLQTDWITQSNEE